MGALDFTTVNVDEFKKGNAEFAFQSILFNQIARVMEYGSRCPTSKEYLTKFERSIKMLEAFLINNLDEEYKKEIKTLLEKGKEAKDKNNLLDYYEYLRMRFMRVMQIVSTLPDVMPEVKAIERIGFDE